MAKNLTTIFNEVAVAIQEKTGKTTPIAAEDFGSEIKNIKENKIGSITIPSATGYNLIVHLDKLKENLPEEFLNRTFSLYSNSGYQLAFQYTKFDGTTVTYTNLCLCLFELFDQNYNRSAGRIVLDKTASNRNGTTSDNKPIYNLEIEITGIYSSKYISGVKIYDGITVREFLDNISEAIGSNLLYFPNLGSESYDKAILYNSIIVWEAGQEISGSDVTWVSATLPESGTISNISEVFTVEKAPVVSYS